MKKKSLLYPEFYPDHNKYNFFITLEGLDATYKETNAKAIAEYINQNFKKYIDNFGLQVKIVSFPRYKSEASYFVKKHLNGKYVDHPVYGSDPRAMNYDYLGFVSNLFLLDMYDWYETMRTNGFFSKPSIIIFDRYWYSMLYYLTKDIEASIYQKYINDPKTFIEDCQIDIFKKATKYYNLPITDVLVNLHNNSIKDINAKINHRGKKKDSYESDDGYLGFVRNVFNSMDFTPYVSAKYSSISDINVENKDRDMIKEEIITNIKPALRRYKSILCRYKKK